MIKLPARVPQGQSGFTPAAYQNIQVSQAAFDSGGSALASMGKAMTSLGGSLDDIGQSMERDQVRQAVTEYDRTMRTTVMGSAPSEAADGAEPVKGFLSMQGPEAVTAYAEKNQALLDAQNRLRDSLPNGRARDLFDRSVAGYAQHAQQMMDQHYQSQIPIAQARTAEDASIEAKNMAVVSGELSPELSKVVWSYGVTEAGRAAALNPTAGVTPEVAQGLWQSSAHRGIVQDYLAQNKLDQAESYLQTYGGMMTQEDAAQVTTQVGQMRDRAAAEPVLASFRDRLKPSAPVVAPPAAVPTATGTSYPYASRADNGLPSLEKLETDFKKAASAAKLTPSQQAYGWDALRRDYAQSKKTQQEQRGKDLNTAMNQIAQGATVAELPVDLWNRFDPATRQGLDRYFARTHGLAADETDWGALAAIAGDNDADFSQRTLLQDLPYLSSAMHRTLGNIQGMLRSDDLQKQNQGQRYLRGLRLGVEAIKLLPPDQRTSGRVDMMIGDALRMTTEAEKSGKVLSRSDLQKRMAPYLHEARVAQAVKR